METLLKEWKEHSLFVKTPVRLHKCARCFQKEPRFGVAALKDPKSQRGSEEWKRENRIPISKAKQNQSGKDAFEYTIFCCYDRLIEALSSKCSRHLFAIVEPDKKAFLYLDLDQPKNCGTSWSNKDEIVQTTLEYVKLKLEGAYGRDKVKECSLLEEPFVFDATSEEKHSFHIHWMIPFESGRALTSFMLWLGGEMERNKDGYNKAKEKQRSPTREEELAVKLFYTKEVHGKEKKSYLIDLRVYNRYNNFRLPFNTKLKRNAVPLLPFGLSNPSSPLTPRELDDWIQIGLINNVPEGAVCLPELFQGLGGRLRSVRSRLSVPVVKNPSETQEVRRILEEVLGVKLKDDLKLTQHGDFFWEAEATNVDKEAACLCCMYPHSKGNDRNVVVIEKKIEISISITVGCWKNRCNPPCGGSGNRWWISRKKGALWNTTQATDGNGYESKIEGLLSSLDRLLFKKHPSTQELPLGLNRYEWDLYNCLPPRDVLQESKDNGFYGMVYKEEKVLSEVPSFETLLGEHRLLLLKADCGTGKTKRLMEWLKTLKNGGKIKKAQPLGYAVVPLKSLVSEIYKRWKKVEGDKVKKYEEALASSSAKIVDLGDHSLITTPHSLWKFMNEKRALRKAPYVLVLDEVESLFDSLITYVQLPFQKRTIDWLDLLIEESEYVIAMDAHLSDRTVHYLSQFKKGLLYHLHCPAMKETSLFATFHEERVMERLIWALENGKKAFVVCDTKKKADKIHGLLKEKFPKLPIQCYTRDTTEFVRKDEWENCNKAWAKYSVLIINSAVVYGMSFEIPHFDACFAFFNSIKRTVLARQALQMLRRVRELVGGVVFVVLPCFFGSKIGLPDVLDLKSTSRLLYQQFLRECKDSSDRIKGLVRTRRDPSTREEVVDLKDRFSHLAAVYWQEHMETELQFSEWFLAYFQQSGGTIYLDSTLPDQEQQGEKRKREEKVVEEEIQESKRVATFLRLKLNEEDFPKALSGLKEERLRNFQELLRSMDNHYKDWHIVTTQFPLVLPGVNQRKEFLSCLLRMVELEGLHDTSVKKVYQGKRDTLFLSKEDTDWLRDSLSQINRVFNIQHTLPRDTKQASLKKAWGLLNSMLFRYGLGVKAEKKVKETLPEEEGRVRYYRSHSLVGVGGSIEWMLHLQAKRTDKEMPWLVTLLEPFLKMKHKPEWNSLHHLFLENGDNKTFCELLPGFRKDDERQCYVWDSLSNEDEDQDNHHSWKRQKWG
jgi:hypothetical protein